MAGGSAIAVDVSKPTPALAELHLADEPALWSDLGFAVADGRCRLGGLDIVLTGAGDGGRPPTPGLHQWGWTGLDPGTTVATIPTIEVDRAEPPAPADPPLAHANRAIGAFYVVLFGPSWAAAAAELAAIGLDPGDGAPMGSGRAMRRSLADAGPITIEVIGPEDEDPDRTWQLWGMIVETADIDRTAAVLGPRLRQVKPAVQRGRRIATLDRSAGSSTNLAFLSPVET